MWLSRFYKNLIDHPKKTPNFNRKKLRSKEKFTWIVITSWESYAKQKSIFIIFFKFLSSTPPPPPSVIHTKLSFSYDDIIWLTHHVNNWEYTHILDIINQKRLWLHLWFTFLSNTIDFVRNILWKFLAIKCFSDSFTSSNPTRVLDCC